MSTQRPRIQAYLDPQLYDLLLGWKKQREIPKESEAINQILKEYFGLFAESPKFTSAPNSEELRLLIQEELWGAGKSDFIDGLTAEAQAIIAKEVSEAKEYWEELNSMELVQDFRMKLEAKLSDLASRLEAVEDSLEIVLSDVPVESNSPDEPRSPEADLYQENGQGLAQPIDSSAVETFGDGKAEELELPGESPSELNLSQLARHLKISKSVISRRKTRPDFQEWSKATDPSGKTWSYDQGRQIFTSALQ